MAETKLNLVLDAVDKTKQAFDSAKGRVEGMKASTEKLEPAFSKMATVGTVAFGAITAVVGTSIKAFAESEQQLARVDAIINTMDASKITNWLADVGDLDTAREAARYYGDELQRLGGISGELGAESFARLLQQTNDVEKSYNGMRLAADLATAKQMDLGTATTIISKVMNGNIGILGRYGIAIDENATKEEALAKLTATFGGQYEKFGKTLAGQTAILKESFGDLQENIGQAFLPILTEVLQKIQPVLNKVIDWAQETPKLVKEIVLVSGAVAALVAGLGFFGLVIPKIIGGISLMITVAKGLGVALAFLATNPIGLVITAIGLLITAIVLIVKNWEFVKAKTTEIWNAIVEYFTGKLQEIKDYFQQTWDGIKLYFTEWWNGLSESTKGWIFFFLNIITGGMFWLVQIIMKHWTEIKDFIAMVLTAISDFFIKAWNGIMEFIMPFLIKLGEFIIKVWGGIREALKGVFEGISGFFKSMWEGMKTAASDAVNWLVKKIQPLLNMLDRIASFGGGAVKSAGNFITRAGEKMYNAMKVDDAIISPDGKVITTNPKDYLIATKTPGDLVGGGAGMNFNLTLTGNTFMGREGIAEQIGDEIANIIKRQIRI